MAWEQVFFKNTVFPNYQGTIVNFDCCENTYVNRQTDDKNIAFINQYLTGDLLDSENFFTTETEVYRKGIYSITVQRGNSGPGYQIWWRFKIDNQQLKLSFLVGGNANRRTKVKIALAINETEHKAAFIIGELSVDNYFGSVGKESSSTDSANTATNLYNWLKENLPSSYTWQSVKSLKGINDFSISLPILSNINDGDPVSGASSSAFTKLPSSDNNVKSLVNLILEPIPINNAVTITYTIPALKDDSYSSVKIYAKIGEVPKCDETDDIVEDIDPTINEISLENLEYETEYFFCIQSISNNGLKLSSNVESITTDELEGTTFDFTGNEQIFVVPETGMYSLETWGAQGQSDENNRGGYGAYAYAEAFLTQGQTLYINVGGQNGYNGGGNYQHGTIRNILIPDSGQSFIIDERCWTQTGTTPSAVYPDSTLTCFALGSDMGKIRNEIGRDNYVVLWERNGIKCYVGITQTNASFGEPKFCCAIYNEKNERVLGSLDIRSTYSQEFGPYCGFDAATEDWYNSNVRARLYHWGLAYGVDDTNHLGYVVHCYGQHRGYYENTNLYLPQASYDSSYYGWNAAKLYDALIRASQ